MADVLQSVSVAGPQTRPMAMLRLREPDAAAAAALGAAFALTWPTEPNTTSKAVHTVLWLSPGEWAILDMDAAEVAMRTAKALGQRLHHLSDVSDGRSLFRIDGEGSRRLIAQACSLDLHPRVFPPDACAQTQFTQVPVLLYRSGGEDRFDIVVDASLAGHLSTWFAAAGEPAITRPGEAARS
jgi:sarcosine oxidase subunit gamma